jgi:hypothetical protein
MRVASFQQNRQVLHLSQRQVVKRGRKPTEQSQKMKLVIATSFQTFD